MVTDMDGTLLWGRNSFPYFALLAIEVSGVLRLLFLLLASLITWILYYLVSQPAGINVLIFVTFVGMRVSDMESVARVVLSKFYSSDLHPESWWVISSCRKRCILMANPEDHGGGLPRSGCGHRDDISTYKGRATGLVRRPGVLVVDKKADALREALGDEKPDIGLGDQNTGVPFMELCKVRSCYSTTVKFDITLLKLKSVRVGRTANCVAPRDLFIHE